MVVNAHPWQVALFSDTLHGVGEEGQHPFIIEFFSANGKARKAMSLHVIDEARCPSVHVAQGTECVNLLVVHGKG